MAFPATLDTVQSLLQAVNGIAAPLTAPITSTDVNVPLTTVANYPVPIGGAPGLVSIDNEVIAYTGISSNTLTGCLRGQDGTLAAPHAAGAMAEIRHSARYHNALAAAILAIEAELGANPSGSVATVTERIAANSPTVLFASGSTWVVTVARGRAMLVQCWVVQGDGRLQLTEPTSLKVDVTNGEIVAVFPSAVTGYVVAC